MKAGMMQQILPIIPQSGLNSFNSFYTHTQIYEKSFLDTLHLQWWSHPSQKYMMKRLQATVTSCNKEYSNCEKSINYIQWAWLSTGTGPMRLWDLHSWTSSWLNFARPRTSWSNPLLGARVCTRDLQRLLPAQLSCQSAAISGTSLY